MKPCVEYEGCKTRQGYGWQKHEGKARLAHRVAYCEAHGLELAEIDGLVVRHRCDNPPCIEPEHLVLGTQADNVADMVEKLRHSGAPGEVNGRSVLTEAVVLELRRIHVPRHRELGGAALARRFGLSPSAMHDALTGKHWSHL